MSRVSKSPYGEMFDTGRLQVNCEVYTVAVINALMMCTDGEV